MRPEKHTDFRAKMPLFLSDFNLNCNVSQILE
jgi:hypothetical protein